MISGCGALFLGMRERVPGQVSGALFLGLCAHVPGELSGKVSGARSFLGCVRMFLVK